MHIGKRRVLKSEEDLNPNDYKSPRIETESMTESEGITLSDVSNQIKI